EADEVTRQVNYAHRLAHVEDVDLAVPAVAGGLQDELGGLRDGHEVPDHVGVRHGDGPAGCDLALEDGYHAAAAAQHVAEADRHELLVRAGAPGRVLHQVLDEPLGGAHDRGGVHRLVRRDVHEVGDAVLERELDEVAAADYVVEDRLFRVLLHERHVLVSSGMEDDVGAVAVEDVVEPGAVLDGTDDAVVPDLGPVAVELSFERVDAVLAVAEEDQVGGVEAADLPHQLGADGAAGAGDHHALAAQVAVDAVGVELHGGPAEEVVDVYLADPPQVDAPGQHLVHAGDDLVGQVGTRPTHLLDDVAYLVAALGGDGDEHLVDLALGDHLLGVRHAAQHRHAGHALTHLAGVVVEERDRLHAGLRVAQQLAHDQGTGLAGSHHQHALAEVGAYDGGLVVLVTVAGGRAYRRQQQERERAVEDGDRARDAGGRPADEQGERAHHRHERAQHGQAAQVAERDVAPGLLVQVQQPVGEGLQRERHDHGQQEGAGGG